MIDPTDEIELAIHEAAWTIVEQIKDKTRIRWRGKISLNADGHLILQTPLPDNLPPGDYTVTLLIEKPSQE